MAKKVTLTASDGSTVEFYDEIKAQGGVKDVYFSTDKTYVVAFYRKPTNANDKARLENIVGIYREKIFIQSKCAIHDGQYDFSKEHIILYAIQINTHIIKYFSEYKRYIF